MQGLNIDLLVVRCEVNHVEFAVDDSVILTYRREPELDEINDEAYLNNNFYY